MMNDRQFALIYFLLIGFGFGSVITALAAQVVDVLLMGIMSLGILTFLMIYALGSGRLSKRRDYDE